MINRVNIFAVTLATLLGCAAGGAVAAQQGQIDMEMLAKAKVSVAEAIDAAEKETGGKAVSAAFSGTDYEVDVVMTDFTVHSLQIDAQTGKDDTKQG